MYRPYNIRETDVGSVVAIHLARLSLFLYNPIASFVDNTILGAYSAYTYSIY